MSWFSQAWNSAMATASTAVDDGAADLKSAVADAGADLVTALEDPGALVSQIQRQIVALIATISTQVLSTSAGQAFLKATLYPLTMQILNAFGQGLGEAFPQVTVNGRMVQWTDVEANLIGAWRPGSAAPSGATVSINEVVNLPFSAPINVAVEASAVQPVESVENFWWYVCACLFANQVLFLKVLGSNIQLLDAWGADAPPYTSSDGDTLSSIATDYGVSVSDLQGANPGLADPIPDGTSITIPSDSPISDDSGTITTSGGTSSVSAPSTGGLGDDIMSTLSAVFTFIVSAGQSILGVFSSPPSTAVVPGAVKPATASGSKTAAVAVAPADDSTLLLVVGAVAIWYFWFRKPAKTSPSSEPAKSKDDPSPTFA